MSAVSRASTRTAGAFYLVVIAGGLFAEAFVREVLIAPGDPAATARSIAASEPLWRAGIAVHLLYLPLAVVVNIIVYRLVRWVQPTLALVALACSLIALAVEAASLLTLHVPLTMIREGESLSGVGQEQQDAVGYVAARLFSAGFGLALVFFAVFAMLVGVLVFRSQMMPRAIGVLMVLAGLAYVVSSLAAILSPELSARLVPWILLPSLVGELSFGFWLLIRGVWSPIADLKVSGREEASEG